ncbi:serine palmitoyltransferase small subunit A-like [Dreissena polymorpha]|uniref:serine palmitoyltransferase small subunit A-like n=1 Tax=Dreissena polymorpha TaxID=45954 RepID=UPI002264F25A|nr:serine palmitoyltransferase small subunit A-like [Dreissena polymorpha]
MGLKKFIDLFNYWYLQYTLNTAVYMLEPTEVKIVNSILVAIIALAMYSAYVFLPGHAVMMVHFVEYLLNIVSDPHVEKVS